MCAKSNGPLIMYIRGPWDHNSENKNVYIAHFHFWCSPQFSSNPPPPASEKLHMEWRDLLPWRTDCVIQHTVLYHFFKRHSFRGDLKTLKNVFKKSNIYPQLYDQNQQKLIFQHNFKMF